MARIGFRQFRTALFCIALLSVGCFAQSSSADKRKNIVDQFLRTWLVRKNIPAALNYFHKKAFTDDLSIDCGCCSAGSNTQSSKSADQSNEIKMSSFLKDLSHTNNGPRLNTVLFLKSSDNPEVSAELKAKVGKRVLNRPRRDRYYLVDHRVVASKGLISEPVLKHFAERYNLRGSFYSIIQYRLLNEDVRYGDDVVAVLLWVRDKGSWKLVNVGIPSCN